MVITLDALAPLVLAVRGADRDRAGHRHVARRVLRRRRRPAARRRRARRSPTCSAPATAGGPAARGDRSAGRRGPAVHRRHDRHAEGRDADPREHLRQRRADRELDQPVVHRSAATSATSSSFRTSTSTRSRSCMMVGLRIGALQIIHPEVRARGGAGVDPRLPADLLPGRADDLRVAAQPSEGRRVRARARAHCSTAAARRARSR